jgi:hypothetical protein
VTRLTRFATPGALLLVASLIARVTSASPSEEAEGRWKLDPRGHGDQVQLTLERSWDRDGSNGQWVWVNTISRRSLRGMPSRAGHGPASMALVHDAGTIHLEGRFDGDHGSGRFTFERDPDFVAEIERQGLGKVSDLDLLQLCADGLGREWIRDLRALGLHGVSLADLIRLHDNGVTPEYVRGLASAGYDELGADDVIRLRNNDVTVEYVRDVSGRGARRPSVEHLVRFRNNGLEARYVAALAPSFQPEDLIRLHNNGLSADYVRDFRALGYESASADELIRLHNNDVTPAFARRAQSLHGRDVTTEELIKLRINGVE